MTTETSIEELVALLTAQKTARIHEGAVSAKVRADRLQRATYSARSAH